MNDAEYWFRRVKGEDDVIKIAELTTHLDKIDFKEPYNFIDKLKN